MKKIFPVILCSMAVSIFSCDKIEGPTRENISLDTTCQFTEDNSIAVKKVLVEDYTGHTCGNCPAGGIILNDSMRTRYGDRLVVITVHAGDYADPCPGGGPCPNVDTVEFPPAIYPDPFAADYKTDVGTEWNTFFQIVAYPGGMVDRIDFPNNNLKPKDKWDQDSQARLNLPAKARIRIQNTYDETDRKLRACIETKFLESLNENYKLSVVVTEDSVIDWQVWYGHNPELVFDYVHHHMFRTSMNSAYGVNLGTGSIEADTKFVSGYSITVDPSWNPDHCAVVAFVYNASTYEVLQVEEAKIR
jgi:hypothetical protein